MSHYELGPIKSENPFEDEGMLGHFSIGYPPLSGTNAGGSYQESNPHVNLPNRSFLLFSLATISDLSLSVLNVSTQSFEVLTVYWD